MEYRPGLLPVFALVSAVLWIGCGGDRYQEIVFKAPFGRLPATIARGFDDLEPGDSAEIRLEGEWFDPPIELSVIAREDADLSSPLSASEAAYSAFKIYQDDWIVASFAEADRDRIQEYLSEEDVRAGSQAYYQGIESKRIHGWTGYEKDSVQYRFVFVDLASVPRLETFVLEEGEWRRTNALVADSAFQVAWTAYRYGTINPP